MKNKAAIICIVPLLILFIGCATGIKSPETLAKEYTAKAQKYEEQGDVAEALKQYQLVLTVEPANQLAQQKTATLEPQLKKLAEEHYKSGIKFYNRGEYSQARKEFLTALRYNPDHAKAKARLTATSKDLARVKRYIVHTVQEDESISTLAERYYGDYRKFHVIAEYNELEDATRVSVGQEIKIPVFEGVPIIADPADIKMDPAEKAEPLPGEVITVKRYIIHTVQPEETLSRLAQLYYGDSSEFDVIAKFNDILDGTSLRVGQKLKIPEVAGRPFLAEGKVEETKMIALQKDQPPIETKTEAPKKPGVVKKTITPEDQTANYRKLGIELYKNKAYSEAIVKFEAILKNNPKDSGAVEYLGKSHFQQGLVLFGKEEYLAARDEFKSALKYNKNCDQCEKNIKKCEDTYKEVHYQKGLAYFGDQKLAEAIREWETVTALDPDYKDVNKNLTRAKTLYERLESIK